MSSKFWLVAQREYVENLRTKAFWIGIFLVPVLLVAAVVIPIMLDKAKDVRRYVVVDQSGWLVDAIERRAEQPDFEKILRELTERGRERFEKAKELTDEAAFKAALEPQAIANDPLSQLELRLQKLGTETTRDLSEKLTAVLDASAAEEAASDGSDAEADAEKKLEKLKEKHGKLIELGADNVKQSAETFAILGLPDGEELRRKVPKEVVDALLATRQEMIDWWKALPEDDHDRYRDYAPGGKFQRVPAPPGEGEALLAELNQQVQDETLFAYFLVPKDPVSAVKGSKYVSNNLTDDKLQRWFESLATDVVRARRFDRESISPKDAAWLLERFTFDARKLSKAGVEEGVDKAARLRQWAPVAFVYLLWIAIFSIAQMLLTNTIEEKSNRILEVLLSSVSPLELMVGKIFGIALTGLTVVVSWVISFVVVARFVPLIMGKSGLPLEDLASDPAYLLPFIAYFFLGYLFYAALFVGIGSVCNSIKEANNLMMPVTMVLMVPLLAMVPVGEDPNGRLAVLLSFIPPFTPFVMMNRAANPPAAWEYLVTTGILIVSVVIVMWAAAKVFRIGVLMTGKAPTPREILRWIRAPVGQVPQREQPK